MNRPYSSLAVGGFLLLAAAVVFWGLLYDTASSASPLMKDEVSPATNLGKVIYDAKCAMCHGTEGKGDGIPSILLNPKPRDFTDGRYKFRSTESGSIPTDADLIATVKNGLHATSMPDWGTIVGDDSVKAVVEYIKSFSPRFRNEQPKVVSTGTPIPSSAASIAIGKKVYAKLQCAACHGTDGKGTNAIQHEFTDEWGHTLQATNLTEPWTFRGGATARDVFLRFRTGIDGTPMPSYKGSASDAEMWHLANYVLSLARKPIWKMDEAELNAFFALLDQQSKADPLKRGKYLVESIGCVECHSTYNENGSINKDMLYAGGFTFDFYPFGQYPTRNITSDKETGLGNWTDEEIKRALTQGISKDGRKFLPFPMPWTAFAQLKEDDVNAIVVYLRTIPPVTNKVPEPQKPNIFSYMWGKFRMLILKERFPAPGYLNPQQAALSNRFVEPSPKLAHSQYRKEN